MSLDVARWINRFFERCDTGLARLQRRCPKCGGELHRQFSFLDKIGLFLPLPHTIYAQHQCARCGTRFRSYRTLTDFFLEASWVAGLYFLGPWKALALAGTFAWLVTASLLKRDGPLGMDDAVMAGAVTGVVWVLALVFGDVNRGNYLTAHPVLMCAITGVAVLGSAWVVLFLDRYTNFGLQEC